MDTDSRQPRGRDSALSLLNVTIETLDLAKEVSSIPQAAAAFASVSILLTMIRVRIPLPCDNDPRFHDNPGLQD